MTPVKGLYLQGLACWDGRNNVAALLLCRQHLDSACKAVLKDNVNLAAFFAWSFLDNFEWTDGYRARYGIVHVDRASKGLDRYPKLSAQWLSTHFFRCAAGVLSSS